jgi:gluconate 2-dehydrogenase subunit 3-like protein
VHQRSDHLTDHQQEILSAIGETLLPGAAEAGLVAFIEQNLGLANPRLFVKYRDLPLAPVAFYRSALDAVDQLAIHHYQTGFTMLSEQQQCAIVDLLIEGDPPDWHGPPANEVFTVLRMDAFDVLYGVPSGYDRLGLQMHMHIAPERSW